MGTGILIGFFLGFVSCMLGWISADKRHVKNGNMEICGKVYKLTEYNGI